MHAVNTNPVRGLRAKNEENDVSFSVSDTLEDGEEKVRDDQEL